MDPPETDPEAEDGTGAALIGMVISIGGMVGFKCVGKVMKRASYQRANRKSM